MSSLYWALSWVLEIQGWTRHVSILTFMDGPFWNYETQVKDSLEFLGFIFLTSQRRKESSGLWEDWVTGEVRRPKVNLVGCLILGRGTAGRGMVHPPLQDCGPISFSLSCPFASSICPSMSWYPKATLGRRREEAVGWTLTLMLGTDFPRQWGV